MKRTLALLIVLLMTMTMLAGCGGSDAGETTDDQAASETTEQAEDSGSEPAGGPILVAYFTRIGNTGDGFPEGVDAVTSASINQTDDGLKGNAQLIAEWVADETGADLFAIQSEEVYPADYNETVDKASKDQSAGIRPALTTKVEDMSAYSTVIIVYPNWWADLPMPVYSFFDEYDLSGKNIVAYCTHEGSRYSDTINTIKELEPEANVKEGLAISGGDAAGSESKVRENCAGIAK